MKNRFRLSLTATVPAVLLVLLSVNGCVGYRLGSMLPPDIQTVHVPTFLNETDEPLIEVDTTRAMISAIQLDGSLLLASQAEADALLTVRLIEFRLESIAFDRTRRAAADEYRMFIKAAYVLTRQRDGSIVAQSPEVIGQTTFVIAGDLTSSKQSAIPAAARDLAQLLVSGVVETW